MIKTVDIIGSKYKRDEIIPFLIEVELTNPIQDSFLQVKETLTRIGIASSKENEENTLYQTCHILSKKGRYYLVHFKHLFILDGRENNLTVNDISRYDFIAKLLESWGLFKLVNRDMIDCTTCSLTNIKIVKHSEKNEWNLKQKFSMKTRNKKEMCHE